MGGRMKVAGGDLQLRRSRLHARQIEAANAALEAVYEKRGYWGAVEHHGSLPFYIQESEAVVRCLEGLSKRHWEAKAGGRAR